MKKVFISVAVVFFMLGLCRVALASSPLETVSFSDALENVDGSVSGWSGGTAVKDLKATTWSILGGQGTVTAYGGNLTHRLYRGIGISGGEFDEIDGSEYLVVDFELPYWVNSVELRSLFNKDGGPWEQDLDERGRIDFYNGGKFLDSYEVTGLQPLGTNGTVEVPFSDPYAVNKLIFFVPHIVQGNSEFALSKMKVTMTPEPLSTVLFIIGAGTLVAAGRKRIRG